MMFTGGSPEVQNLVNQAMAARAEANGNGAPERDGNTLPLARVAAEQGDPNATPPPDRPRRPSRRAARTAPPSPPRWSRCRPPRGRASGRAGAGRRPAERRGKRDGQRHAADAAARGTPPAPRPVRAASAPNKSGGAAAFRETLWFKQGDVDQMVADARAKLEASKAKGTPAPEPEPLPIESDAKPLEERYVDDGSVSAEDRKKYSLRQGATSAALPTVGGKIPGERMSAEEVMGEIGGGKRFGIVIAAVVVVAAIVAVIVLGFRGKKVAQNAAALTPVTVPEQPAAPHAAAGRPRRSRRQPAPRRRAGRRSTAADDDQAPSAPKPHSSSSGSSHKHASAAAAKKTKSKHHH